ncbi:MAG: sigma 54-interacting transcriptional regulator [Planctomycetota bacterium]|nr:sigma 54-interacting transcriptional regulator [Planctomycetota bacterium]
MQAELDFDPETYKPEFDSLKRLLLDMARERSLEALLGMVVRRLAERAPIALVRIWLLGPGDICPDCPMRAECPDRSRCLHLVASAGRSIVTPGEDWSGLDGHFRRFPIGVRKVGRVAAERAAVVVHDTRDDLSWFARPDWALAERIRGFCGQPILHKGEVLGVLALFPRMPVPDEGVTWLRIIADHLAAAIANARAFEELAGLKHKFELECEHLREEVLEAQDFGDIIGQSAAVRGLVEQIELVAPTDANVLILGESGTGKELVAREIHRRSSRADEPMVRVNCASIPRELYESEFFGHVMGAFTGAIADRAGRFELADHGTLFLDEVGEIPLELQAKLLRALQEGTYERVGDARTREVDVRVVAATNKDLKRETDEGRFRQDLYYRLNVFPIEVAPLRRRREDIPLLAAHFGELAARKLKRSKPRLTQAGLLQLQAYDWPGNVRELQNVIERALITSRSDVLRFDLPASIGDAAPAATASGSGGGGPGIMTEAEMRRREKENTRAALDRTGWKVYGPDGAAELLGIRPTTLASRIKKLGLKKTRGNHQ